MEVWDRLCNVVIKLAFCEQISSERLDLGRLQSQNPSSLLTRSRTMAAQNINSKRRFDIIQLLPTYSQCLKQLRYNPKIITWYNRTRLYVMVPMRCFTVVLQGLPADRELTKSLRAYPRKYRTIPSDS